MQIRPGRLGFGLVLICAAMSTMQGKTTMQERRVIQGASPAGGLFSPAVAAGGFVFVSALTAQASDVPAARPAAATAPDIGTQTTQVLERLRTTLESAGSSLKQAVSVSVYLRQASDFEAMNATYRAVFAESPPARTTVVTTLPAGALVAMSAVAVENGVARETLHPAGWPKSPRPYSYIVRANGFVFFAGLVSRRGIDDQVQTGSVDFQVKVILENAGTLLRTAGLDYSDVVSSRVFITDDSLFGAMNEEYGKYFASVPPARATAVTSLMGNDASVEIQLVASTTAKEVLGAAVSPSLPLSSAVRSGPFTFLSGVLGNTTANANDPVTQTHEIFTRVRQTLTTAGLTPADVVENTVFLTDLWNLPKITPAYREFFPKDAPAGALVGAPLVSRSGLIEMMMTAYRPPR